MASLKLDDIDKDDETMFEGDAPTKGKRGRKPGQTATAKSKLGLNDIADKIHLICLGVAKIMGKEFNLSQNDFMQEAKATVNMIEKFPQLETVFKFFDPIIVVFGLFSKFSKMPKAKKEEKQVVQPTLEKPKNQFEFPV